MKTTKIIFWTTTIIVFLMEGVIVALTSQTDLSKQGIRHLGYPEYFGNALAVFKVLGALSLITPPVPNQVKEWAYTGLGFVFLFASISHAAVDGFGFQAILPLIFFGILSISYLCYHRLNQSQISEFHEIEGLSTA